MEINSYFLRQDRAIDKVEFDALDRGSFVDSLIKTLVHSEHKVEGEPAVRRATGYVIGLTGEWGLGKSSVLNLLGEELARMDGVVVATLNPWLFKGRDELINAYFSCLRDALGKSNSEKVKELQGQLEKYKASIEFAGSAVASIIDIYAGGTATTFWKTWIVKALSKLVVPKQLTAVEERKALELKLTKANVAVVVLIDELDRVEDDEVRAVAQLVKAVGDIKGISYLVAYDPERVVQALGKGNDPIERMRTGESYLEKIIQYAIPLRPLLQSDVQRLMDFSLKNNNLVLPEPVELYQHQIIQQLLMIIRTPREIKRLIGVFAVLEEVLRGEVCVYDLLVYSWLVTKAPSIRDLIAKNPESVVDDPGTEELITRSSRNKGNNELATVSEVLGASAERYGELIRLVFPRFRNDSKGFNGNRISKRRNLIRLLYLGNPPGMFQRNEVQQIWGLTDLGEAESLIVSLHQGGRISNMLDRLSDLRAELNFTGKEVFWVALTRTLVRQHDWIDEEENLDSLADDIGALIWKFCKAGRSADGQLGAIVASLIEDGDLVIVPWILRKHLFAHGLTSHPNRSSDEYIYGKNETVSLLSAELPRYRKAVLDGRALRRIPNMEAIYCMVNTKNWDGVLREGLTLQLDSMQAVGTFAALTVRPGFGSSRKDMDDLVDADVVLESLKNNIYKFGFPQNSWLAASVRRLRSTLEGKETWAANIED